MNFSNQTSAERHRKFALGAKFAISFGLLGYLIWRTSLGRLYESLVTFQIKYFIAAFLIDSVVAFFFALKWYFLLRRGGVNSSPFTIWGINLIAAFYHLVLPKD